MKRILLYILLLVFVGLGSCKDDFLTLYPETVVSAGTFYKTANDFNMAIIASYVPLRTIASTGIYLDEMRSDNTFFTYLETDRGSVNREYTAEFLDDATTNSIAGDRYTSDYSGISRVNTILGRIDGSKMTEDEKNSVMAEALFLRAFYYFDLVQKFGPVPLMLKEVTSDVEAFQPNSTIDAIYKQIMDDVNKAIQIGLPVAVTFPQSGRATLGAAKMLLAYAYMTKPTREYALAEALLVDITKMNYGLLDNYADVFNPKNKNNRESIFEVQYKEGEGGQQSNFAWIMIPRCDNDNFLMGVKGSGTTGGWNVPTQEMIDSYESGDKRLNASVAVAEGTTSNNSTFTVEAVKNVAGYTQPSGKSSFYFVTKYYHPPYSQTNNTGDNFPVYRYSGALLLLAECLIEVNKTDEALPYLNQVRYRAGLDPLNEATKENVANEMRHELAYENHRWTDLIRTDKAIEVMTLYGKTMKSLYGWLLPQSFNVTKDKLLYPFYFHELEVNKNLNQNPGY